MGRGREESARDKAPYGLALFTTFALGIVLAAPHAMTPVNDKVPVTIIHLKENAETAEDIDIEKYDLFGGVNRSLPNGQSLKPRGNAHASLVTDVSSKITVPENYTELRIPDFNEPVYAFVDSDGVTNYRIGVIKDYGSYSEYGFVPVKAATVGTRIEYKVDPEEQLIDLDKEDYGIITVEDAPANAMNGLEKIYGFIGLYLSRNAGNKYFLYGSYPNGRKGFYAATNKGEMIPGRFAVKDPGK